MVLEHGCFLGKERFKLILRIFKSFEILGVFCFLSILPKLSKLSVFFFLTFFYSQSWHPLLMLKVLTN